MNEGKSWEGLVGDSTVGQKIVHMFDTFGKIQDLQDKYYIYQTVISKD